MKKIFKIALWIIIPIAVVFFVFAPQYLDKSMNKVVLREKFTKNNYYDSIPFIADLHCDALL